MPSNVYEIRICDACGLRYPLQQGHSFGVRCPACMGETRVILSRQLVLESDPNLSLEHSHTNKGVRAVLLDNIRSGWNVGSIFRSADGFGYDHAYLCGITPTPENEAVTKTSLGAEDTVTWSYHKDAVKLVKGLKRDGWKVYALEDDTRAVPIKSNPHSRTSRQELLILGSEVTGIDPELLGLCDAIYYIPMRGEKKSFNVAIAFSIAAYALR
jgi:23S rRNA (guanosine2251-2'-O)-methyltransferase